MTIDAARGLNEPSELDTLEPAIPPHLRRDRTRPLNAPPGFVPKHASYSARFAEHVTSLPVAYIGLQFPPGTSPEPAIQTIEDGIAGSFGPLFHDRARYIDSAGYENLVFALYWCDQTRYHDWRNALPKDWWHSGLALDGPIGAFEEAYQPSVMDAETTFSHRHREGSAVLADTMSGKTDTHEYWGSARDRIPRAQVDDLAPGEPDAFGTAISGEETRGRRVVVPPSDNLCVLRSGQDWGDTAGPERRFYLEEVRPLLEQGMREIDEDGHVVGCYFNRFMQVDDGVRLIDKTYSLSVWQSLADLEAWVKTDTHLKIFGAGIRHYKRAGEAAKLRLYHEMTVLRAADQSFVYFNCHRETGMLRSVTRAVPSAEKHLGTSIQTLSDQDFSTSV